MLYDGGIKCMFKCFDTETTDIVDEHPFADETDTIHKYVNMHSNNHVWVIY